MIHFFIWLIMIKSKNQFYTRYQDVLWFRKKNCPEQMENKLEQSLSRFLAGRTGSYPHFGAEKGEIISSLFLLFFE